MSSKFSAADIAVIYTMSCCNGLCFNTLRLRQNILQMTFSNENKSYLNFVPQGPTVNNSALVQCQTGDKPLPEAMITQFTNTYTSPILNDLTKLYSIPSIALNLYYKLHGDILRPMLIWCHLQRASSIISLASLLAPHIRQLFAYVHIYQVWTICISCGE